MGKRRGYIPHKTKVLSYRYLIEHMLNDQKSHDTDKLLI